MPHIKTDDGIELYYEQTGSGEPVIFVHEFAGDFRSWESQMRHFGKRYLCIAFNARGYPPSDVPDAEDMFSQGRACDDILAVLEALKIHKAHVVGLSMGGFAALHFGLNYPQRAHSLVVAGCGYGAETDKRAQFRAEVEATAKFIDESTGEAFAAKYAEGPTRVQFRNKDPRGWQEFRDQLAAYSRKGASLTMRGVQKMRPSLYELEKQMRQLTVPTLIMTGDEDEPCLAPAIFMKRVITSAALVVLPNAGHTINLEEPGLFNSAVEDFLAQVSAGRWPTRDPQSVGGSILGMEEDAS